MKKLMLIVVAAVVAVVGMGSVQGQPKKVAVWEAKCVGSGISPFKSGLVRGGLEEAVDNTPGYIKYDRALFDAIIKEHKFQQSGAVKDEDIRRMGEMAGVQYIIVPEVSLEDSYFYIVVRILDIETGQSKTAKELCESTPPEIDRACAKLAARLLGGGSGGGSSYQGGGSRGNGGSSASRGQDFTETAFGINMRMVYVEGGTFTMGCTGDQGGECDGDEKPGRQTTVGSFYIGMLEVTQSQWEKVMGTTIYQQRNKANPEWPMAGTGTDYPMYYVSWEEAKEFCARLSRATGRTYSLPTEAEWEYAARGGRRNEGTKYAGGWTVDDVAWYDGNSGGTTHPCGTKRANALGLYDMSGNVWEWCEDWYGNAYPQYDDNNPKGPNTGSSRVLRGGSWYYFAKYCRVANRNLNSPGYRIYNFGFRVVVH